MSQPARRGFYRPELDLLRFVAFLLVFFDHALGGFGLPLVSKFGEACRSGLPVFFLLSSYLITELLLREHRKTGTIHIKAFFLRRVLRIWPLYLLFLTAVYLAWRLGHGYFPGPAFLAFLFISGNWYVYAFGFLQFAVGPLWSISVEEQFYLVWPFLVLVGAQRALKAFIPVVLLASVVAIWYSGHYDLPLNKYWTNSLIQFQFFAFGAIIALVLHDREFTLSARGRGLFFGAGCAAFLSLVFLFPLAANLSINALHLLIAYGLMGVMSVCLFLGFYGMRLPAVCSPLVYLGRISYGMYVFHLSILQVIGSFLHRHGKWATIPFQMAGMMAALGLTILVAMASYRFLESPFLRLKDRFTFVHSRS
jgi:peptidoglycan/LPS O-acetylase OafA/YrhL